MLLTDLLLDPGGVQAAIGSSVAGAPGARQDGYPRAPVPSPFADFLSTAAAAQPGQALPPTGMGIPLAEVADDVAMGRAGDGTRGAGDAYSSDNVAAGSATGPAASATDPAASATDPAASATDPAASATDTEQLRGEPVQVSQLNGSVAYGAPVTSQMAFQGVDDRFTTLRPVAAVGSGTAHRTPRQPGSAEQLTVTARMPVLEQKRPTETSARELEVSLPLARRETRYRTVLGDGSRTPSVAPHVDGNEAGYPASIATARGPAVAGTLANVREGDPEGTSRQTTNTLRDVSRGGAILPRLDSVSKSSSLPETLVAALKAAQQRHDVESKPSAGLSQRPSLPGSLGESLRSSAGADHHVATWESLRAVRLAGSRFIPNPNVGLSSSRVSSPGVANPSSTPGDSAAHPVPSGMERADQARFENAAPLMPQFDRSNLRDQQRPWTFQRLNASGLSSSLADQSHRSSNDNALRRAHDATLRNDETTLAKPASSRDRPTRSIDSTAPSVTVQPADQMIQPGRLTPSLTAVGTDTLKADSTHAEQLAQRVLVSHAQNLNSIRLSLQPAELGQLDIQLTVRGEQLHLVFTAHQAAARELIEGYLPQLRALINDAGLNLGDVDVRQGADRENQEMTSRHQTKRESQGDGDRDDDIQRQVQDGIDALDGLPAGNRGHDHAGRIDAFV